jgi:hypothetical protein
LSSDLDIDGLLVELGFSSDEGRVLARLALEEEGLTHPRKHRIAEAKRPAIEELLRTRFRLVCARPGCRARDDGRITVDARSEDCSSCGGETNKTELTRAVDALVEHGLVRVVIVGGSPSVHDEITRLVGARLQVRLVPGTDRRSARDAKADLAWAHLVVVWGSTELDHKVSMLYTGARDRRVVVCPRRGVAALAQTLLEAVVRRAT